MKRRTITKLSLEALASELKPLAEHEQVCCVGGGTGTEQDPYTYNEYQNHLASGTWGGGYVYVDTSFEENRRITGSYHKSSVTNSYYIGQGSTSDEPVDGGELPGVEIPRRRRTPQVTGSWQGTVHENDGFYYGVSGNYSPREGLINGGMDNNIGGGSSHQSISWDVRSQVTFKGFDRNDPKGCLRRCLEMIGLPHNTGWKECIEIVQNNGEGRAGENTLNSKKGIELISTLLAQGRPVIVGIDYQPGTINNGITDHFVVIVSSRISTINGERIRIYEYYDSMTRIPSNGTSNKNFLYEKDGKLIGKFMYHRDYPQGMPYTVTEVRRY